ncbi:MAG: hypothetical protein AAGB28_16910, partial [Pseudomonadota bacterium]
LRFERGAFELTQFLSALTWADAIGSVGALAVILAYFATQMRMMHSSDLAFPVINLIGSILIFFSLLQNFNLASMFIECFWIAISLIGIIQFFRLRHRA